MKCWKDVAFSETAYGFISKPAYNLPFLRKEDNKDKLFIQLKNQALIDLFKVDCMAPLFQARFKSVKTRNKNLATASFAIVAGSSICNQISYAVSQINLKCGCAKI